MNNVDLYSEANELQRMDAIKLLNDYKNIVKWKEHGDRTIDIGCGDGGVTMEILRKYMPKNYEMLVGCDINQNMVDFASKQYNDDKTKFINLNIEGATVPKYLLNSFDHALSFYVLHWIVDHKRAFQNIYDLLDEGGDCLLMFLGYNPAYDAYRELVKNKKFTEGMGDIDKYISKFHDSLKPEKDVAKIMAEIGFKNIDVKQKKDTYVYRDFDSMKRAVAAINPFKIPEPLLDEYIEKYLDFVCGRNDLDKQTKQQAEPLPAFKDYILIIAYGTK